MMNVSIETTKRSELSAFADAHGLELAIYERLPEFWPRMRYYAHFKGVEVVDGCMLAGVSGNGPDPLAAVEDYARRISNRHLVRRAYSAERYEFDAPLLMVDDKARIAILATPVPA